MCSGGSTRALPRVGFPIRRSRDQRLVSTSPGLFAAAHVLLRLLAPRHPPCALVLLIKKNTCVASYGVFKVRTGGARRTRESRPEGRSLKTQQRTSRSRSTLFPGEPVVLDGIGTPSQRLKSGTEIATHRQVRRLQE